MVTSVELDEGIDIFIKSRIDKQTVFLYCEETTKNQVKEAFKEIAVDLDDRVDQD